MGEITRYFNYNSLLIHSFSPSHKDDIKDMDSLKYHYTSPEALRLIIENHCIFFTDIRYLNDRSEDIYLVKILLDVLSENKNKYPVVESITNQLFKNHSIDDLRNLRVINIDYNTPKKYTPVRKFVFCTAIKGDLLNMWNYYVKSGRYQGYNIGFNIEKLLKTFDTIKPHTTDPFEVLYGSVIYDSKKQRDEIIKEFEKIEVLSRISEDINNLVMDFRFFIDRFGAFFKNPSFSIENEYRICIVIDEKNLKKDKSDYFGTNNQKMKYRFRESNGLIVPYIEVQLPKDSISRINISPMMEIEIAKESLRELLTENDYKNVQIYKSKIPVRF